MFDLCSVACGLTVIIERDLSLPEVQAIFDSERKWDMVSTAASKDIILWKEAMDWMIREEDNIAQKLENRQMDYTYTCSFT